MEYALCLIIRRRTALINTYLNYVSSLLLFLLYNAAEQYSMLTNVHSIYKVANFYVLTPQMADASANPANAIWNLLEPGTEYMILSAHHIQTSNGTRLIVEFHGITHSMLCAFHPRVRLLSNRQIEDINTYTLSLVATYYGLTESGDPVFQIRDAALPAPSYEELEACGAFNM